MFMVFGFGERGVFYGLLCGLWCCLVCIPCVYTIFLVVMCVTVFCLLFSGFVFLDSTNSFFVAYVTIFYVR